MTGRFSRGHGIRPSASGQDQTEAALQGCESVFCGRESALHKVGELIERRPGAKTLQGIECGQDTHGLSSRIFLSFSRDEPDSECWSTAGIATS